VIPDLLNTLLFIGFLLYYRIRSTIVTRNNVRANVTAGDYAVMIKGLPKEGVTAEDISKHFAKYGEVREVCFAREYDDILKDYAARAKYSYKLGFHKLMAKTKGIENSRKVRNIERKIQRFDEKIAKREEDSDKTNDELPVNRAYVVFEDVEHRKQAIL
jgi:RNA recognition motif-containing protein